MRDEKRRSSAVGVEDVLTFWFGELDEGGFASDVQRKTWWKKDSSFDAEIRERFGELYEDIAAGKRNDWLSDVRGQLAYVIVLDQFSRNMFRGEAKAFAADPLAQAVVKDGVLYGNDQEFSPDERVFFYMPLMHSETLEDQEQCMLLFERFYGSLDDAEREKVPKMMNFAKAHRDIVARFGRFPHRNETLGRESTAEELAFLKEPGSSF